ncbi:organic solute transporter subunit alpha [Elysia marginata]|uniref:Organic solute transporter subunit alpha n=1 Tax=Elysia marginata TaxID=1093978 RepID=A0AAV4GGY4_9GAST|nr:organic solute transporter subunit alpha [Elysia marginata]
MSRSVFHFVSLMTLYFGGKKKLLHRIRDDKIILRAPPCCCCCCCLPMIPATQQSFTVLKILVLQAAIVLPVLNMASVVLWLDGKYHSGSLSVHDAYPYLTAPTVVSTLLSFYAYIILYRLCRRYLASLSISVKFLSLQLAISLTKVQTLIMSILAANGIPACCGTLSTLVLSQTYRQMVLILEMFLLSLLARRVYRDPHDEVAMVIAIEANADETVEGTRPDVEQTAGQNSNHELKSPVEMQCSLKLDAEDDERFGFYQLKE